MFHPENYCTLMEDGWVIVRLQVLERCARSLPAQAVHVWNIYAYSSGIVAGTGQDITQ